MLFRLYWVVVLLTFFSFSVRSQVAADSSLLSEVVVKAYFSEQPILSLPSSVSVIGPGAMENQPPATLVPVFNTVPGVRMEERSPGSYRLSIRGSLLRSPYGVRNVKIYMDEFLLTDAGGNTYLNALDAGSVGGIEILKGPEGSIFGANSGGVIRINPETATKDSSRLFSALSSGSYGLFHEKINYLKKWKKFQVEISQAYQRADGYRQNSDLDRRYVHILPQWKYGHSGNLKAIFLFSDLKYRTPGGLTASQYESDPSLARPRAGQTPGAAEQQAGIFNKNILAGLSNELRLGRNIRHVISVTGSHTDFKNPFITNYEVRDERSAGIRSYFEYADRRSLWKARAGFEGQETGSDIDNYKNDGGSRGSIMASDYLKASQSFWFLHLSVKPVKSVVIEAALSLNDFKYKFSGNYPLIIPPDQRKFDSQLMPRLAASYTFSETLALRASVSRGYSSPTLAEVRASDNMVNTLLGAETGWNREAGFRLSLLNNRLYWDAVLFYYSLKNAIVRRLHPDDTEYFVNAGGTRQLGTESELVFRVIPERNSRILQSLQFRNSYTYSNFHFRNYSAGNDDFSGNKLTGVPEHVVISSLNFGFPGNMDLFIQHNYTSALPLNDSNSSFSRHYNLVTLKASWDYNRHPRPGLKIFFGIDNLLNEVYSPGSDLNAFGGRYFNAASPRNFFAGLNIIL